MRDSIRSNAPTALFAWACEFASQRLTRRLIFLAFATLAAVIICSAHAAVAGADTVRASGVGYLVLTLVLFGCALAFWTRARSAQPTLYVRWAFLSAGALAAALGYLPSFTQAIFNTAPARWFQTASFNASEALYMLAAVLFCAGASRSIVIVDLYLRRFCSS